MVRGPRERVESERVGERVGEARVKRGEVKSVKVRRVKRYSCIALLMTTCIIAWKEKDGFSRVD